MIHATYRSMGCAVAFAVLGFGMATPAQADEYVKFENQDTGRCLNVHGREQRPGGALSVYSCADTADQEWVLRRVGADRNRIVHQGSGLCLATASDGTEVELQVARCSASETQLWLISGDRGTVDGARRLGNTASGFCVTSGRFQGDFEGAPVVSRGCTRSSGQSWLVRDLADNGAIGLDLATARRNATVRLEWPDGSLACSGVLVSSSLVLSAAHCWDPAPRPRPASAPPPFGPNDWETPGEWQALPFPLLEGEGRERMYVRVGSNDSRLGTRYPLVGYNLAGHSDIMLLRLDGSVPRSAAIPADVLTRTGPQIGAASIERFLRGKRLLLSGWGALPGPDSRVVRFRKLANDARFVGWPTRPDGFANPAQMNVDFARGSVIEGGDSGGPLYVESGDRLTLIGITQAAGRHVMTFFRGGYRLPSMAQPDIALWLDEQLGTEDCVAVDGRAARVVENRGRWQVVQPHGDGIRHLFDFGSSRTDANLAVRVLRAGGVDRRCFVRRPGATFQYLLADGEILQGRVFGERCGALSADRPSITEVRDGWTIDSGSRRVFSFSNPAGPTGDGRFVRSRYAGYNEAHMALSMMRDHEPRYVCAVGSQPGQMMYFRR